MHARAKVALREMHPSELTPASKIPHGTPPRSTKRLERKESMMPRLTGRRTDRNMTPPADEAADKATAQRPQSPGTPPLALAGGPGGNTIEDDTFFEHLPDMLAEIGEKLTQLLDIESHAVRTAAAAGLEGAALTVAARDSEAVLDAELPEQVSRVPCTGLSCGHCLPSSRCWL
eukprot:jgi/Ulvmu1/6036/UM027_0012.1